MKNENWLWGPFVVSLFFGPKMRQALIDIGGAFCEDMRIQKNGAHEPRIILFSGTTTENGLPESLFDVFFEEFQNFRMGPITFGQITASDSHVVMVMEVSDMIRTYQKLLRDEIGKYCDSVQLVDPWLPVVYFGEGFASINGSLRFEVPLEDMTPRRIALGRITQGFGFERYKIISKDREELRIGF